MTFYEILFVKKFHGGVSNYNDLTNKPSINSHVLAGNQTSAELGIIEPSITSSGDIYFGTDRVGRKMDKASYDALTTKEKIYYLTYPTPAPSNNMQTRENVETPTEREDIRTEPEEEPADEMR